MGIDTRAIADFYEQETLGAPENAVGFVLWRVMHRYQREIDRALAPHDLTHLQFTTLAMAGWLSRKGEPATQAELARRADIHAMQVSHMLKTLDAKGLIERAPSPSDTRVKLVELTAAGLDALRAAMPVAIAIQQRMFGAAGNPKGVLLMELLEFEKRAG